MVGENEIKVKVDTRGLSVQERQKVVKDKASLLKSGEVIEVVSNDERMPVVAEHIAKALGLIELIEVVKDGGLYHGYFRRK